MTHLGTLIACCPSRYGMVIPVFLKGLRVGIDIQQEQKVKKPQMSRIFRVQVVLVFQSLEECAPASSKLASNLNP